MVHVAPHMLPGLAVAVAVTTLAICYPLLVHVEPSFLDERREQDEWPSEWPMISFNGVDAPQKYVFIAGLSIAALVFGAGFWHAHRALHGECRRDAVIAGSGAVGMAMGARDGCLKGCCCCSCACCCSTLSILNSAARACGWIACVGLAGLGFLDMKTSDGGHNLFTAAFFMGGYINLWCSTALWRRVLANRRLPEAAASHGDDGGGVAGVPLLREEDEAADLFFYRVRLGCIAYLGAVLVAQIASLFVTRFNSESSNYYYYVGPLMQYLYLGALGGNMFAVTHDIRVGLREVARGAEGGGGGSGVKDAPVVLGISRP